jgi:hypothetical protein
MSEADCQRLAQTLKRGLVPTREGLPLRSWSEYHDALTCEALAHGDDKLCAGLTAPAQPECRRTVAFYRWARKPQENLGWRCDEHGRRKCAKRNISPADCEAMCTALRTRDPSKCPALEGEEGDGCRAEAALDPRLCRGRQACVEEITREKEIATGGLIARLRTATGREKTEIEATLKGDRACAAALESLHQACVAGASKAAAPAGSREGK